MVKGQPGALGYQRLPSRGGEGAGGGGASAAGAVAAAGTAAAALLGRRPTPPAHGGDGGAPRPRGRAPGPGGKAPAPGQPLPPARARDRFVSLPEDIEGAEPVNREREEAAFDGLADGAGARGRITTYCVAEALDRRALELRLRERDPAAQLNAFPDCIHARHDATAPGGARILGDVFYFEYGVVVAWGLPAEEERAVVRALAGPAAVDPLPPGDIEVDEFEVHYTLSERPHIQNDTFTINWRAAGDHVLKLSISHALAQSAKLSAYEERVLEIVEETRDLPEILATTGRVALGRKQIAQLIGRVFIQKGAVALQSTVLDTPEFFWSAPDAMQALYKRCCEYLEYDNRVEVLNTRFQVLQEMLDMCRDHLSNLHSARLEWIVIWLIVVEVVVGLVETASLLGWIGREA
jgi:uncharacterized Rmd1/YagE family protein